MRVSMLALLLLGACAAPPADAPRTVAAVDLDRSAGTWFEVARFPNRFEDGSGRACAEVTATYTPRPDGRVGVRNTCRDDAAGGLARDVEGQAYVVEGSNGSKLRVSFFWPFFGNYWMVGLSPDYRWAVVGDPRREYLWVLARTPNLPGGDYAEAVGIARAQGFDITRLRATRQAGG